MTITVLLLCVLLNHAVYGFTPRSTPKKISVSSCQMSAIRTSLLPQQAKKQGSSDETEKDVKNMSVENEKLSFLKKSFEFVILRALDLTSFAFTFVGVASFCGLLLNVMGYGYQIGQGFTLEIDTLEHMRLQNEFRREIMRSMHDVA
jgi:hypothetical protein